jgi:hypothetical protein
MATARKICRYSLGQCPRGDSCMFHHDAKAKHPQATRLTNPSQCSKGSSASPLVTTQPYKRTTQSTGVPLCKYHLTGSCIYGKSCRNLHTPPEGLQRPQTQPLPCNFFNSISGCKNGEKCRYSHCEISPGGGPTLTMNAVSVMPHAVGF